MAIIKSNSALVAFDNNVFLKQNEFTFLTFLQSFQLSVSPKRLNQKSLGSSSLIRNQFVKPDVTLDLTFMQSNNFNNEILFGFKKILSANTYESFAKDLIIPRIGKIFKNNSANIIFSENKNDLLSDFQDRNFTSSSPLDSNFLQKYITITLGNLFLKSGIVCVNSCNFGNVADDKTILGILFFFQFLLIIL